MPCPRLKNTKVGKIMKRCGNLDVKITRPWNNHSFFAAFLKEPPGPPWPFAMSRVNLFFSWSCAIWMPMMKIILVISPHVTLREWQGSTEGLEHEIDKMRFWDLIYTNYMLIDEIFVSKIRKWRKVKQFFFTSGCTCWKGSSMEQKCSFEGYYWKDFPIATLSQSLHQLATKFSFDNFLLAKKHLFFCQERLNGRRDRLFLKAWIWKRKWRLNALLESTWIFKPFSHIPLSGQ